MKSPKILVDLDNVLADQRQGFYRSLEQEHPDIPRPALSDLIHFDIELNFQPEYRERVKKVRLQEGFFRNLPMLEGAKDGISYLESKYGDVRIVTAPIWDWQHCVQEKYAWVEKHLGRDWTAKMILTRDKTFIRGDILIDDAPEVKGFYEPTWEHVLYDQPHNNHVQHKRRFTWDQLKKFNFENSA